MSHDLDNTADSLPPGRQVGRYTIKRPLGAGGAGAVYEAHDCVLQRDVALKILTAPADSSGESRLLTEAQAVARLSHPNVVAVYDAQTIDGAVCIAMELVLQGSAARPAGDGKMPFITATRIIADACRGLVAAHAAGLVHRDIKPANLLCAPTGTKLADFGLARTWTGQSVTESGHILTGTPHFMSPEQCRGEPLDQRTDIYSLGATYYALLAGAPPYDAAVAVQIMFAHCSAPAPDVRTARPDIPAPAAAVIARAMAKDPADRYPSAAQMLADLQSLLPAAAAAPSSSRPLAWLAAYAAIATIAAAAILLYHQHQQASARPTPSAPLPTPPGPIPGDLRPREWPAHAIFEIGGRLDSVAISPDGALIAAASSDGGPAALFEVGSRKQLFNPFGTDRVQGLAFETRGVVLAAAIFRRGIRVRELSNDVEHLLNVNESSLRCLASHGSMGLFAAGLDPAPGAPSIRVFDPQRRGPAQLFGHADPVVALAFDPIDARRLVSVGLEGRFIVHDLSTGQALAQFELSFRPLAIAWSPDGRTLAVAGPRPIHWFDTVSWKLRGQTPFPAPITALAYSRDGRLLFCGNNRGLIVAWNIEQDRPQALLPGHAKPVLALAASTDGAWLASASADGSARVWRIDQILPSTSPPR